jgi:hypothetical protein
LDLVFCWEFVQPLLRTGLFIWIHIKMCEEN